MKSKERFLPGVAWGSARSPTRVSPSRTSPSRASPPRRLDSGNRNPTRTSPSREGSGNRYPIRTSPSREGSGDPYSQSPPASPRFASPTASSRQHERVPPPWETDIPTGSGLLGGSGSLRGSGLVRGSGSMGSRLRNGSPGTGSREFFEGGSALWATGGEALIGMRARSRSMSPGRGDPSGKRQPFRC